jgi:hypothetical protein
MPSQRQITVRRAPKYVPFLVAGGVLGVIVAAITSYSVPAPKDYTQESVFGYFLVLFAAGGVLVGGIVALVLDRLSLRRSERATVEEVEGPEDGASADGAVAEAPGAAGSEADDADRSPSSGDVAEDGRGEPAARQDGHGEGTTPAP